MRAISPTRRCGDTGRTRTERVNAIVLSLLLSGTAFGASGIDVTVTGISKKESVEIAKSLDYLASVARTGDFKQRWLAKTTGILVKATGEGPSGVVFSQGAWLADSEGLTNDLRRWRETLHDRGYTPPPETGKHSWRAGFQESAPVTPLGARPTTWNASATDADRAYDRCIAEGGNPDSCFRKTGRNRSDGD